MELLHSLERNWKTAKVALNLTETIPPIKISLFGFNILQNNISRSYANQLGILKAKYGQRKLYLITSPKYNEMYTNTQNDT